MITLQDVQNWLRGKVAQETGLKPEAVSLTVPFTNYGLDSIVIVTLVDDLEDWLNLSLDPTIFWEFPTIETLSNWLVKEHLSK